MENNEQIEKLNKAIQLATLAVVSVREIAEEYELLHTQEYIEFEDFVNRLSTFSPDRKFIKNDN